jgi:hypothetical protein
MPEPHSGKARTQGTTDNNHTVHCTQTAGSADVKVQNIQQVQQIVSTEQLQQCVYLIYMGVGYRYIIVSTEQLQQCVYLIYMGGWLQVHNCKYRTAAAMCVPYIYGGFRYRIIFFHG